MLIWSLIGITVGLYLGDVPLLPMVVLTAFLQCMVAYGLTGNATVARVGFGLLMIVGGRFVVLTLAEQNSDAAAALPQWASDEVQISFVWIAAILALVASTLIGLFDPCTRNGPITRRLPPGWRDKLLPPKVR